MCVELSDSACAAWVEVCTPADKEDDAPDKAAASDKAATDEHAASPAPEKDDLS